MRSGGRKSAGSGGVFKRGAKCGFPASGEPAEKGGGDGVRWRRRKREVGGEGDEGSDGGGENWTSSGGGGGGVVGEGIVGRRGNMAEEVAVEVAGGSGCTVEEGGQSGAR
ncbi:unnamed protein product [Fraxinus pennsylvanica]|uniref:Uncharacterized protein n=1 Tax=Fraxinus pennsylvanica TaxID=56036 RepID=A0AAD1YXB4_9LAMI|nr:unnamed protein product [Fraxinus pennsylvanica]